MTETEYRTQDLALVAVLLDRGFRLLTVERDRGQPHRRVFLFEPAVRPVVAAFYQDAITVEPRAYFKRVNDARALVRSS